jgi:BA14K-like protein
MIVSLTAPLTVEELQIKGSFVPSFEHDLFYQIGHRGSAEWMLSTKSRLYELLRRGSMVLLAAAAFLFPPPAWSQNAEDSWETEGSLAVFRLRDCVTAFADRDSKLVQEEKWSALLIAAIDGDCRSAFDGMIQLFARHVDAKDVELRLRTITDTTLLPALKEKRGNDDSTASTSESPTLPKPDPVVTQSIIAPDSAGGRRALESPDRGHQRGGAVPKSGPGWLEHCRAKYTSYNPKTGLYRSYGGVYRPCR